MDQLTKKERKELRKMEQQGEFVRAQRNAMIRKWGIWIGIIALIGGGLWWLVNISSKPFPGQAVEDQGREHIKKDKWEKFEYNSNPPTSGSHDADWKRAGVYDEPQGEGYLVHSLEHGYVVISYNCEKKLKVENGKLKVFNNEFSIFTLSKVEGLNSKFSIPKVFAHEDEGDLDQDSATKSSEFRIQNSESGSRSAELLEEVWKSKECSELKKQLKEFAESQRLWKLIVVPRPQLDTRLALTAWTRIDKFGNFDKDRMVKFIDAFRDKGPEKTME